MAELPTAALALLRLAGFRSIRAGLQAVMHDIKALLAVARGQPLEKSALHSEQALLGVLVVHVEKLEPRAIGRGVELEDHGTDQVRVLSLVNSIVSRECPLLLAGVGHSRLSSRQSR
jgi:hypothetical protein